jgi:acetyltransferase-like isoleucine patch superfamily enzyme
MMVQKLTKLYVFGNGGAFKEIAPLIIKQGIFSIVIINNINESKNKINSLFESIEEDVFFKIYNTEKVNLAVLIGDVNIRKKIVELIKLNIVCPVFPSFNFTENNVQLIQSEGTIIMPGSFFTDLSVIIGSFNYFNFNCFIAHDVSIDSFNTFSPFVKISGNCVIKSNNFLGTGCILFPRVLIDNSSIGAGVVVKRKIVINKIIDIPKSIIYEKR